MNLTKSKNTTILSIHIGVWIALFLAPVLFFDKIEIGHLLLRNWIPLTFSLGIFYINYLLLIPKYFENKKTHFVFYNLILVVVSLFFIYHISEFIRLNSLFEIRPDKIIKLPEGIKNKFIIFPGQIPFLLLGLGSSLVLKNLERIINLEKAQKESENENLRTEINALKYQIQPHFFFNTLNNIYSLIDIDSEAAKDTVLQLSKLMRYLLYKTQNTVVPLKDEIHFIESFIKLMKLRFSNHVDIQTNFQSIDESCKIPPLLLITDVENAFKHGIDSNQASAIQFELNIKDNYLTFKTTNTYFPKNNSDRSGSGIGTNNLKKRLHLFYNEDEYSYKQQRQEDLFVSELIIKII